MSDCIQVQILTRLAVIIAADYSSGFSGYNLSSTGKVITGFVPRAPQIPSACIFYVDTIEQQGRTLGRYVGESVYQIVCYTGGFDISTRMKKAINLASDIQKAITTDRTLGLNGLTEDVIVQQTALDGEEYGISQTAVALLEIRVQHQSQFGV